MTFSVSPLLFVRDTSPLSEVPRLLSVDDVVSFNIATSYLVFVPLPLIRKLSKTETQPIMRIQSPDTIPPRLPYLFSMNQKLRKLCLSHLQISKMMTLVPSWSFHFGHSASILQYHRAAYERRRQRFFVFVEQGQIPRSACLAQGISYIAR